MSVNDEFAAAAERLTLAREIKRQEANARVLLDLIERKKARLAELERRARCEESATPAMVLPALDAPDLTLYAATIVHGQRARAAS